MDWKPSFSIGAVIKFALMYALFRAAESLVINVGGDYGRKAVNFIENPFGALGGGSGN